MVYKIEYKSSIGKDLKKLEKKVTKRILNELEKNLRENPNIGVPLSGQFKDLFKYRVGDYRIIYAKTITRVLILRIGHRSKIYK